MPIKLIKKNPFFNKVVPFIMREVQNVNKTEVENRAETQEQPQLKEKLFHI